MKNIIILFAILTFAACKNEAKNEINEGDSSNKNMEEVDNIDNSTDTNNSKDTTSNTIDDSQSTKYNITNRTINGITIGSLIGDIPENKLDQSRKVVGDQVLTTYKILDENDTMIAYFKARPNDELVVGEITVVSPDAMTETRIRVGDSFEKIKRNISAFKIKPSIDGLKTDIVANGIIYRLAHRAENNELTIDTIPGEVKVKEIVILDIQE